MSALLSGLAVLSGVAVAVFAVVALFEGSQAVRIGGTRLLFNGWDWFAMSDRVPEAARPHMRKALRYWLCAMGCLVLAAVLHVLASRVG